jgi:hypothetical protein
MAVLLGVFAALQTETLRARQPSVAEWRPP